jgi:hypothetical protein
VFVRTAGPQLTVLVSLVLISGCGGGGAGTSCSAGGLKFDILPYQVKAEPTWLDVAHVPPASFTNSAAQVSVRGDEAADARGAAVHPVHPARRAVA